MKLLILLALLVRSTAFSVHKANYSHLGCVTTSTRRAPIIGRAQIALAAFSGDGDDEKDDSLIELNESQEEISTQSASSDQDEKSNYPINLPSPILLSGSMVLGIAGVGRFWVECMMEFSFQRMFSHTSS